MDIRTVLKRIAAKTGILQRIRRARAIAEAKTFSAHDRKMMSFYAQFITPGGMVFDVGANVGNRTKIFLALGARVVAFEPQNECAEILRTAFGRDPSFTLVNAALGAKVDMQTMMIADVSTVSSLSPEWVGSAIASRRFGDVCWERTQTVQVETIENQFIKHGVPDFVKIDVEGYELEVIRGLSRLPRYLSMEFIPEQIDKAIAAIRLINSLEPIVTYRISLGESMEFSSNWSGREETESALRAIPWGCFGDIYAQRG